MSAAVLPTTASSATSLEEQARLIEEALGIVKVQSFHMKKCLVRRSLSVSLSLPPSLFFSLSYLSPLSLCLSLSL
jgi:hypothetical protein